MPYLVKGPRPDINNGPGVTRIAPTFWPGIYSNSTRIMAPSPGHSNLGSDGRYICSSLPLMVWWVPYLNKGCTPDFNNGLGGDSNSGLLLAPWRLFESDSNIGPSPGHSNLCQMKYTFVQVSYLRFPVGYHTGQGPILDFNSGPEN